MGLAGAWMKRMYPDHVHAQAPRPRRLAVHSGVKGSPVQITDRDRFWMSNKIFQFFRFVVLNLKILKGVDVSERA